MLPHIPQIENLVMDYYKEEWEDFLKLNYYYKSLEKIVKTEEILHLLFFYAC